MTVLEELAERLGWNKRLADQEAEERKRLAHEAYLARVAEEKREEQKRQKVRELQRMVKDARIMELITQSGFEYNPVNDGVELLLPYNYRLFIRVMGYTPYVEIHHELAAAHRIKDFLLKYSDWIEKNRLMIGIDAKLNKPHDSCRLTYDLPMMEKLVLMHKADQLTALQPTIVQIVQDATDIFVQLAERMPSLLAFKLRKV